MFLDAAKAFDRVDHSTLLQKLSEVGLDSSVLAWLKNYLSGRHVRTKVDDSVSEPLPITSGVPQGSVLGPLLFILYFRDIPAITQAFSALFADDTLLYHNDCQGASGCCSLSKDLSSLSMWAAESKVVFNAAKSSEIIAGKKTSPDPLSLDGEAIPRVKSKHHLGVRLTDNLSWHGHISSILERVAAPLNLCKSLAYRHHLPARTIRTFYLAYIRPRLEYCSAVWSSCSHSLQLRLEKAQLQAAGAIARVRHLPHNELLSEADLPTLAWRRCHRLLLMWKLVNAMYPPQLQALTLKPVADRCAHNLRSPHNLEFPSSNSARFLTSFLAVAIPEWNALPPSCTTSSSPASFLKSISHCFQADRFIFGLEKRAGLYI